MKTFYSHGKLLLSGEYLVLDGALALAAPTRLGQWLQVGESDREGLTWQSRGPDGSLWFETHFRPGELQVNRGSKGFPAGLRERLQALLTTLVELQPDHASRMQNTLLETRLEFPRDWGLGSSSTLLSNLAFWAGIDPFTLLHKSFGGSGYDIAAARQEGPFLYQLGTGGTPEVEPTSFNPHFADQLFFVYLNKKQDSREGISRYRDQPFDRSEAVEKVTGLTRQLVGAPDLASFREVMEAHERYIGEILKIEPVGKRLFPDFQGSIKSLGAWGGDFVMATGPASHQEYFRSKGLEVVKPYRELIL